MGDRATACDESTVDIYMVDENDEIALILEQYNNIRQSQYQEKQISPKKKIYTNKTKQSYKIYELIEISQIKLFLKQRLNKEFDYIYSCIKKRINNSKRIQKLIVEKMELSRKQSQKNYDGFSYLEYQYRIAQQRAHLQNFQLNNSLIKLCQADLDFIKDCFGQGKNIIISHASTLPINLLDLKNCLTQDGQKVLLLQNLQQIYNYVIDPNAQVQDSQLIISLHGITSLQFKPYILKLLIIFNELSKKGKGIKYIIYCAHIELEQLQEIIKSAQNKWNIDNKNSQIISLAISLPYQYTITENLLEVLEKFLNDQSKQANKRDVVIFNDPSDEYKKKLFYLTKTKGFHLSSKIIYDTENQISLESNPVSKIYVARNVETLLKQGHDLTKVYLILDYEQNFYNFFNYQKNSYTQVRSKLSYKQKCRRVNLLMGNMGQYSCMNKYEQGNYMSYQQERKYIDYGNYCLSMIQLGLNQFLAQQSKSLVEIKYCVETLRKSLIINTDQKLFSNQILKYCDFGVNPVLAKAIMTCLTEQTPNIQKANLLILTYIVLSSPNLRKVQKQTKPASIWHKTGYLESCLDIIIKSLQFHNNKSQDSDTLFEDIAADLQIEVSTLQKILNDYDKLCKLFKCQKFKWQSQFEEDAFNELLEELITIFRPAVGTFSGSRRLGYLLKGSVKGMLAHRESLMSYYSQKPNFILLLKLIFDPETEQLVILNCNYIRDDILILTYGCLPTLSRQSFGQFEIQFHSIPSATFAHLSKYNGLQMQIFQKENNCSIQANSEINAITIQCSKQKQKQIYEKFENILKDIQQIFKKQTKIFRQSNQLHIVLSAGAETTNLIEQEPGKAHQVLGMALVKNLAPQIGIQELKQLFDEFIQLKDLKIIQKQNSKSAIVSFYSAEHYDTFFQIFSGCNYYDSCMIVTPFIEDIKVYKEEEYLLFQWNVWKSVGQAFIQFEDPQSAKNSLANIRNLAGPKAKIVQNSNMIFAQQLDPKIDQKQIMKWVMGLGKIINLQVRRFAPKNQLPQDISIKSIIKSAFPDDDIPCTTNKIVKGKNGHRSCQVFLTNSNKCEQIYFVLNEASNLVGQGNLYVTPMFTYPIKLPEPNEKYIKVYMDILSDFSKQLGRIDPLETQLIKQPLQYILIIKSNSQDEMTIIKSQILERLKGRILNIKIKDSSILFTELALKNFQKIEKQHPIKIIPSILQKNIKVLCKPSTFNLIQKQINTQIQESFVYHIPLYQKAFFFLQKNYVDVLEEELKTNLKVKFELINRNMVLQGNLFILEKSRQKINKSLKKLKQQAEQTFDIQTSCQLCCQQFKHPFKLQGCGHTFCFDCVQTSIKYQIQDITLYPLKCPQCKQKIWISDLDCLIQKKQWEKVLKIAVNHFVFVHPGEFMFCLTAGCQFIINHKHKSSYICKQCKKGYCLECQNLIHIGMTCHQARYGSDRLFTEYMSTIGGRICANKDCKAPIQRISGCFKVQCSRCKKCMCFKCPPGSMVAYNTPQQTYNHLNKLHGGCF